MKTLNELILECGQTLKRECLRRTGHFHLMRTKGERLSLHGPPLMPGGHIGKVSLNDLVRAVYDTDTVNLSDILKAWLDVVFMLTHRKQHYAEVVNRLKDVYPNARFNIDYRGDPRVPMVQFLVVSSWHFGRLSVNSEGASLQIDTGRLGVYRRGIEWPEGGYRVLREPMEFNPLACLSQGIGKWRNAPKDLAALHRYLSSTMPEKANEIDTFFQVVCYAGHGVGDALVDLFDIEFIRDKEVVDADVWSEALRIIQNAVEDPRKRLSRVLVPAVMDPKSFRSYFHVCGAKGFDTKARRRYRLGVLKAQMEAGNTTTESQAQQLLELNRLLGGSA